MDCLPDELLVQILSFLPTKQAALTSLLSKRWRTLFAFTHNLDFDNSVFLHPEKNKQYKSSPDIQKRFSDFVDRTLALQDSNKINKFSLTLSSSYKDEHDFDRWVCNVLEHGVFELHLYITPTLWKFAIPSKIFTSTTLVKLSLGTRFLKLHCPRLPSDTSLPALKVLLLHSFCFEGNQLSDVFLAACPALEDLTIKYYDYYPEFSYVISSKTIKKLSVTYYCYYCHYKYADLSRIISFDTPNVVDFYYSDYIRRESPKFHLDSLAKATLDLRFLKDYKSHQKDYADVTNLISGIRNVKTLHLTSSAVEVISVCCKGGLPVFNNLIDLVFSSNKRQSWRVFLPLLLESSPNLKSLVLSDLHYYAFGPRHRFVGIQIPPNNQIKMLCIMQCQGSENELKNISHFLLNMKCLEVVKVYVAAAIDDPKKMQLTKDMLKLPTPSSDLKIQVM